MANKAIVCLSQIGAILLLLAFGRPNRIIIANWRFSCIDPMTFRRKGLPELLIERASRAHFSRIILEAQIEPS